jgi:hypothetical protein
LLARRWIELKIKNVLFLLFKLRLQPIGFRN